MHTVALVGIDGAGKTTIARMLLHSLPRPTKYLYMGTSIRSSNFALPTSRVYLWLKLRRHAARQSKPFPSPDMAHHQLEFQTIRRGKIGAAARLLNRLAEEWFRQLISWSFQLRGYLTLYDRHFIFEFARVGQKRDRRLTDRLHLWLLHHVYPQPELVIFLDAPPPVLHRRKPEWSLERLETDRAAMLAQGEKVKNFVCIDASQPVDQVFKEVAQHIQHLYTSKQRSTSVHRLNHP